MSWSADEIKRQAARDVAREQASKRATGTCPPAVSGSPAAPPATPAGQAPTGDEKPEIPVIPPAAPLTIHELVMMLATRDNPISRERAEILAKNHGFTWQGVRYAAGMSAAYRKRGKCDQDWPLLEIRRMRGGRRGETYIWGPAKWKKRDSTKIPRFQKCRGCLAEFNVLTMKFRALLCVRCYFRKRRATVVGRQQPATLSGDNP